MTTIGELLRDKGSQVWATGPGVAVHDALEIMAEKNIGVVLVMEGETLVGILSERDCARKVLLPGKRAEDTRVSEVMTPRVLYVRAEQSVEECMALMTERHIRHLPVLGDGDRVVGVVSMGDVGRAIIASQEFTIAHLENYITGVEAMFYRSS
jgi:signal-transduction protein with cAMP-binding, CBS, and nucleotidyltransferase domain